MNNDELNELSKYDLDRLGLELLMEQGNIFVDNTEKFELIHHDTEDGIDEYLGSTENSTNKFSVKILKDSRDDSFHIVYDSAEFIHFGKNSTSVQLVNEERIESEDEYADEITLNNEVVYKRLLEALLAHERTGAESEVLKYFIAEDTLKDYNMYLELKENGNIDTFVFTYINEEGIPKAIISSYDNSNQDDIVIE